MTLSEIESAIKEFNAKAAEFRAERDKIIEQIKAAGLGTRFAARYLASVTVKIPE